MRPKTLLSVVVATAMAALAGTAFDAGSAGAAATSTTPDLKVALKQDGPYTGDNIIAPPSR